MRYGSNLPHLAPIGTRRCSDIYLGHDAGGAGPEDLCNHTNRQATAGFLEEDMEGRIKKLNCFLQMYHDLKI